MYGFIFTDKSFLQKNKKHFILLSAISTFRKSQITTLGLSPFLKMKYIFVFNFGTVSCRKLKYFSLTTLLEYNNVSHNIFYFKIPDTKKVSGPCVTFVTPCIVLINKTVSQIFVGIERKPLD